MRLAWAALWLLACSADHLVERGHSALDRHDLPEAERSFRRALSREPRNPAALAGLGWTYQVAGQKTAAFGAFDQCAKVAPESAECLRGLASIAMGGGDAARARELLTRAEGLAPDDPKVQSSLALFDVATGDLDAGLARYQRLVDRLPQDGEYRLGLAEAQLRKGEARPPSPLPSRPGPAGRARALPRPCCSGTGCGPWSGPRPGARTPRAAPNRAPGAGRSPPRRGPRSGRRHEVAACRICRGAAAGGPAALPSIVDGLCPQARAAAAPAAAGPEG